MKNFLNDANKQIDGMGHIVEGKPSEESGRVPDKFWNSETNEIRTNALLKSYLDLEKKLNAKPSHDIPDGPDGYEIKSPSESVVINSDLNNRLHEAGFSHQQAQLVYDMADEHLQPLVMEMATHMQSHQHIDGLCEEFGGEEKWREISTQISSWGKKNMSSDVYEALASSPEGIRTLYRMMNREEPEMIDGASTSKGAVSEQNLKAIMRDPRYWRDQDPAIVRQVQKGFETLYPSSR